MAENAQKQAKNDDVVIPVKSGDHVSLVSLGNNAPQRVVPAAGGDVEKAVSLLVHKDWNDEKRGRLKQLALSFFSDVRDRLELREDLQSSWESGGLGVDAAEAGYMVGVLGAVRDGGLLPVRPAAKIAVTQQPLMTAASSTKTLHPPPPSKGGVKPQATPPFEGGGGEVRPGTAISSEFSGKRREEIFAVLAKEIVDEVNPKLADLALRSRLEALIVTRFRGVRDGSEIQEHMKRDASQGGLGLAPEEIGRVMAVVEDRYAKIAKELQSQEKGRLLETIKQETFGRTQKQGTAAGLKEYESNQWYEKRFERQQQAPTPSAPKEPPAVETPPPSLPKQPPEVAIAAPAQRPTMQDAEYRPTLLGPVEELRSMTLADFRRLARDPKEAARRIQDKIRLLEEDDYTQRAAAIAAWRGSVPVKMYLTITRAMFEQGIGPDAAVAAQAAGPDALTLEEYNAIMELQNSLRY